MMITTNDHVIAADLGRGTVSIDGALVLQSAPGRDDTYLAMHREILGGDGGTACTLSEGRQVMRVLDGVERAAANHEWVEI